VPGVIIGATSGIALLKCHGKGSQSEDYVILTPDGDVYVETLSTAILNSGSARWLKSATPWVRRNCPSPSARGLVRPTGVRLLDPVRSPPWMTMSVSSGVRARRSVIVFCPFRCRWIPRSTLRTRTVVGWSRALPRNCPRRARVGVGLTSSPKRKKTENNDGSVQTATNNVLTLPTAVFGHYVENLRPISVRLTRPSGRCVETSPCLSLGGSAVVAGAKRRLAPLRLATPPHIAARTYRPTGHRHLVRPARRCSRLKRPPVVDGCWLEANAYTQG
jgi:hypothetical protein